MNRIIKTEEEYKEILEKIEELIDIDPDIGTEAGDQLEYYTLLVENFESKHYPIELPNPIDAIKYRMEHQNLSPRDLIPYLGSRSKVSEILNEKRPLTLAMIRALHFNLGIPAEVLLQEQNLDTEIDWLKFPIKEMVARGWIAESILSDPSSIISHLKSFFSPLGSPVPIINSALYRKSSHLRSGRSMDEYALAAWTCQVVSNAVKNPQKNIFHSEKLSLEKMRMVAELSIYEDGPIRAQQFLADLGIPLVIEPHLPGTHLDGAAIISNQNMPVIGLTIRFDRLDNFWFSLMHELAHIYLHRDKNIANFFDDLEVNVEQEVEVDEFEKEADELAREIMIPLVEWKNSPASRIPMASAAESLANKLNINPAIVAGRMRYELNAYRHLNNLVGHGEVRLLFEDITWS
jgi:HTH-type transcriptional regulator/antitoxin HigA